MNYDTGQLNTLIRNRRSVKSVFFNGQPVDDAIILQMLENARWAPTHGLTEPWRFIIYSGDARKNLSAQLEELYKNITPSDHFNEKKLQKLIEMPLRTSHVIYICLKRQIDGKISEIEEICAVACAVQNMLLTAEAYGIGCYWSTGSLSTRDDMKEILGLEKEDRCLGFLVTGHYDQKPAATHRTEIEAKTDWYRES